MTMYYKKTKDYISKSYLRLFGMITLVMLSFQNIQAQTYCTTTLNTNGNLYYFDSVRTTGGMTNFVHLNNSPIVVNSSGYTDQTALIVSGLQGTNFQLNLHGRQLYQYHWNVFIDWNQNGILNDPGELVYSYLTGTQIQTTTTTVNIPITATPGNTRMRVVLYRISTSSDPCVNSTSVYGYTTDFTVNVLPLTACTNPVVGGAATISPTGQSCPGAPITLNLSGITLAGGQTYEWESSPNNTTYTSLGAPAASPNLVVQPLTSIWYRCKVVCSGGTPAYSTPVQVTVAAGLSGTYTVNSALPTAGTNFANFTDLATALNCGIVAPVTINVVPGSGPYNETFNLNAIGGASAVNKVRINGNGETIQFNATSTANHRIVSLNGTKYLTIDSLKIKALNATFGWGIHITGAAQYDSIINCTVDLTAVTAVSSANANGIVVSGSTTTATTATNGVSDLYILNNNIQAGGTGTGGGYYGIIFAGTSSTNHSPRIFIKGNEVSNFYYYGIDVQYAKKGEISNNNIQRATKTAITTCYGLRVYYNDSMTVNANKIHSLAAPGTTSTSALYGLYPYYTDNSIFSNNIIYNLGNYIGAQYLFYPYYSDNNKYYHNTINADVVQSASTSTMYGMYINYNINADIKNNIVNITGGNTGTKYGIYVTPATAAYSTNLQKNNIYVNSTQTGTQTPYYFGTAYATLAAFQTAQPTQEIGSASVASNFTAPATGNLTPLNPLMIANGFNTYADVPLDINGTPRSPMPTIGAFEVAPTIPNDAAMVLMHNPIGNLCPSTVPFEVSFRNAGTNNINSVQLNWSINGVVQTPFNYTSTLVPVTTAGQSMDTVVIGNGALPLGVNNIKIWTSNPNGLTDGNHANDTLTTSITTTNFTVNTFQDTICANTTATLSINPSSGYAAPGTIVWENSTNGGTTWNLIPAAVTPSYTTPSLTALTMYRARVSVGGTAVCSTQNQTINIYDINTPIGVGAERCGEGTVNLTASVSGVSSLNWYDVPSGGTSLGTGTTFTTPHLTTTTDFYVAAGSSGSGVVPELIYYKFEQPGSTSVINYASAPVSPTGTVLGTATIGNTGQTNSALVGSGATSATNSVNTNWPLNLTGPWTLSMWLSNVTSAAPSNYLFGGAGGSTFRAMTGSGLVSGAGNLLIRGTGLTDIPVNNIFDATGTPVVVTVVYNPTIPATVVYVNGVYHSQVTQTATLALTGTDFSVGGYTGSNGLPAAGKMDEFRLYNRALSASEVAAGWGNSLGGCESVRIPVTATVRDTPTLNLGLDVDTCTFAAVPMVLDPGIQPTGSTFVWDNNTSGSTRDVNQSGTYHVTVTNSFNCTSSDTISILMREKPAIDLEAGGTTLCNGATKTLDAGTGGQNGGTYYWSTGAQTQTISVNATGTYIAFVTSADGCANSDTVNVVVDGYAPVSGGIYAMALSSDSFNFTAINPQHVTNYEWDFGDGSPISISSNPTHKYLSNGTFLVKMKTFSTCADGLDSAWVNIIGLGMNDIKNALNNIKIYPNPNTQGLLNIQAGNDITIEKASIINLIGQTLSTFNNFEKGNNNHQIKLPDHLISGVYFLKIETNKGTVSKKLEILK